jgi:hypothetical protein
MAETRHYPKTWKCPECGGMYAPQGRAGHLAAHRAGAPTAAPRAPARTSAEAPPAEPPPRRATGVFEDDDE